LSTASPPSAGKRKDLANFRDSNSQYQPVRRHGIHFRLHALDFQFHTLDCLFRLATANSTLSISNSTRSNAYSGSRLPIPHSRFTIPHSRILIPARNYQFHTLDFQFHTLEYLFRLATANSTLSIRCCQLICLDLPKPRKTYTNCFSIFCLAYLSLQALGFHYKNCKKTLFGVHAQVSYIYIYIYIY